LSSSLLLLSRPVVVSRQYPRQKLCKKKEEKGRGRRYLYALASSLPRRSGADYARFIIFFFFDHFFFDHFFLFGENKDDKKSAQDVDENRY
tara:strand:+ start:262 stop:534 length:273 start_codon:yes stop_codon:yes gene_type:complete